MTSETTPIAETNHFIVLDHYEQIEQSGGYQSECDLEQELIADLAAQGYEYRKDLNSQDKLMANLRTQIEGLNNLTFSDAEWGRFVSEYVDRASDTSVDKARKVHDDYVYDLQLDSGRIVNVYLLDKRCFANNKLQVINQFEQTGTYANRYDVTVLVNGLPLVQIELKKRGVAIREAFNQIHRYSNESFNSEHSLFKYLQIFVISNGTDTRYFANTTKRDKNSFDFTMNWARSDNKTINDLKDFTATFLSRQTLLSVLFRYCVFDSRNTLLIMRPYQIAAVERILWKIHATHNHNQWCKTDGGGFIWHTTGSGKTLSSFKAAQLATQLDFIDKVFFVVDRKDLDYQTIKEYQRFSPDSVNGSNSTQGLKENIEKDDNKIIVTTIQKLNNLMKGDEPLPIYKRPVVFIFDECHRSQFGEAQRNLRRKFKKFCQFGFTGTPIFPENALGAETTQSVFGRELHSYVITDAIRDDKVLKFKVDYNDVRPQFHAIETEKNLDKLTAYETRQAFLHPERISGITRYILQNFKHKTHRTTAGAKGFNAMFAVSSVDAAKAYYEAFKAEQVGLENPLKVATIFSFAANEAQDAKGDIEDEGFETAALNSTAKEFLQSVVDDYNAYFGTTCSLDSQGFQNYYRDLTQRVKEQQIDLLIVVGMFLTGFDAPRLNTLFVDKNLRYHGLIQAYSRTNRILDATKPFGNVVTFRDLEQATIDAITLFGNTNTRQIILERSFSDYLHGFEDKGESKRGYLEVAKELQERFPVPAQIHSESEKKAFVKLFGEYLRLENVLKNFDEFVETGKLAQAQNGVTDGISVDNILRDTAGSYGAENAAGNTQAAECSALMAAMPDERHLQDYRSTYNDIRDWLPKKPQEPSRIDWSDVVFEVELLKSQEIDLDYIVGLLFDYHKKHGNKEVLIDEIRRTVRASVSHRDKEGLIVDFIEQVDLNRIGDRATMMEQFYTFAKAEREKEMAQLIETDKLQAEPTRRYLASSLKRGYASDNGTELNEMLPKISPLNPQYLSLKNGLFQKVVAFVNKFRGV